MTRRPRGFTLTELLVVVAIVGVLATLGTALLYSNPRPVDAASQVSSKLVDKTSIGIVIPKGTYPNQDYDVTTMSVPVGAYATTRMDEATAYAVTKAFWTQRAAMTKQNPLWGGVSADMLGSLAGKLHPGAIRYYEEAKVAVPASAR